MPDEALAHFREAVDAGQASSRPSGRSAFDAYRDALPATLAAELDAADRRPAARRLGRRRAALRRRRRHDRHAQGVRARCSSGPPRRCPQLVGGSADLAPSTLTDDRRTAATSSSRRLRRPQPALRHPRARDGRRSSTASNLHGLRAFGATFFNFLDYMKGSIRLAALMELPSIFVFTHDSIGLGEDGPTHQPIEQLAHLRATPEPERGAPGRRERDRAGVAVRAAQHRGRRPRSRSSRQGLPIMEPGRRSPTTRSSAAPTCCATPTSGEPDADPDRRPAPRCTSASRRPTSCSRPTASRRASCQHALPGPVRASRTQAYRDTVLPPGRHARASSVEAAATLGWDRWVGDAGDVVGMTGFGASAPGQGAVTSTSASRPRTSPSARRRRRS